MKFAEMTTNHGISGPQTSDISVYDIPTVFFKVFAEFGSNFQFNAFMLLHFRG